MIWKTRALYGSLLLENTLGLAVAVYVLAAIAPALPKLSSAGSTPAKGSTATTIPTLIIFGSSWTHPSAETLYLLVVISAAAIGATIHALTSLSTFVGNKTFVNSWTWWYIIRLPVGVGIAAILYFILRAGFVSIGSSGSNINAYGVAAFSGLAGMFSKQPWTKCENSMIQCSKQAGMPRERIKRSAPSRLTTYGLQAFPRRQQN
jgi:hypothetical protein